jgi:hypothetical protein
MSRRAFEDLNGNIWIVTRTGSRTHVKGHRSVNESLYEIARSCAYKLGIKQTQSGIPLEYINEHCRIWNTIWDKGRAA